MKLKLMINWNTTIEIGRYDRYWYSASIAYSAPIDVTAAFPTVTQGVVAGLRPNWYNLFQVVGPAVERRGREEKDGRLEDEKSSRKNRAEESVREGKIKRLFAAVEMIMSNQGVDHVIEKKKTNHVIVVFNEVEADNKLEVGTSKGDLEEDFNVMDQPDDLTLVQRADRWRCGGP
ncbi:hypothetical protein L249_4470 [Ophiocordyceps polyrhachis-furcata BCC 54312]|uniref:Uncharacterized protein n=1 Tax=Ophiocordyceps polyrhachis-furcata BCC 54312 TaxID=1330021 RepID=A0A367L7T8_9HYPO|nr:hypothetical protein L249_4470 [Ophiocordyceps polyrhachis-furcata BCC 54312]